MRTKQEENSKVIIELVICTFHIQTSICFSALFDSMCFCGQGEMNPKEMSEEYPIWANQEQNFYKGFAPKMNTSYPTLERWVPQIQTEFDTNKRQMPSSYHW